MTRRHDWRRSPVGVAYKTGGFLLTVDLQHGRGLRLAHAVLRRAGVRALVLLPHAEQAEAVAVADLESGGDKRGRDKAGDRGAGEAGDSAYRRATQMKTCGGGNGGVIRFMRQPLGAMAPLWRRGTPAEKAVWQQLWIRRDVETDFVELQKFCCPGEIIQSKYHKS